MNEKPEKTIVQAEKVPKVDSEELLTQFNWDGSKLTKKEKDEFIFEI